jgi:hypothetical protein
MYKKKGMNSSFSKTLQYLSSQTEGKLRKSQRKKGDEKIRGEVPAIHQETLKIRTFDFRRMFLGTVAI